MKSNILMILLLQIRAKGFQTSPEFPPFGPHKTSFGIFEILSFRFFRFFFFENFQLTFVPYGETKKLNYLENEQS